MLGIILWSSAVRRRAVVWCEDHGPLAYLDQTLSPDNDRALPAAGTTVDVETRPHGALRLVTRFRSLGGRVDLAASLPSLARRARLTVVPVEPVPQEDPMPRARRAGRAPR